MQGSEAADGTPEDLSVWRASSSWSLAMLSYKPIEIHIDEAYHSDWGVNTARLHPFRARYTVEMWGWLFSKQVEVLLKTVTCKNL